MIHKMQTFFLDKNTDVFWHSDVSSEDSINVAVSSFYMLRQQQLSAGGYFGKSQVPAAESTRAVRRDCVGGGREGRGGGT